MLTQDFFLYIDPTDYSRDAKGMFQACYDEVVAEAKDTGDFPMYSENCLIQSAKWKQDDLIKYLQRQMDYEERCAESAIADRYSV